jgi:hypothetical protein
VTNLRKLARDRDCTIRLPGICCHDPSTVVGAHFRLPGLSGMGLKPDDLFIAYACGPCHSYVDTHKDAETQLAHAHGVFRTQAMLLREGILKY